MSDLQGARCPRCDHTIIWRGREKLLFKSGSENCNIPLDELSTGECQAALDNQPSEKTEHSEKEQGQ